MLKEEIGKITRFLQSAGFSALCVMAALGPGGGACPSARAQQLTIDDFHQFDEQEVAIEDFEAEGYILDLGGGGEGLIGLLKGSRVVAIDISRRELEDAPPGPLKLVMDARDLTFLDSSFQAATSCYTLMYISDSDHQKVFSEIYRVLAPGGTFLIWDAVFPERSPEDKERALFRLKFRLPGREVNTGYGVRWPAQGRQLSHYTGLAEDAGFEVEYHSEQNSHFFLKLRKPR